MHLLCMPYVGSVSPRDLDLCLVILIPMNLINEIHSHPQHAYAVPVGSISPRDIPGYTYPTWHSICMAMNLINEMCHKKFQFGIIYIIQGIKC